MALVVNGTPDLQTVMVFGKHYEFKPGEIKAVDENVAFFLETKCSEQGLKSLPKEFEHDFEYRSSSEGKKIIEEKKKEALAAYADGLRLRVYNVQDSLARDMKTANIQADPWAFASKGEMEALEKLTSLQKLEKDDEKAKVEKAKKLTEQLNIK